MHAGIFLLYIGTDDIGCGDGPNMWRKRPGFPDDIGAQKMLNKRKPEGQA